MALLYEFVLSVTTKADFAMTSLGEAPGGADAGGGSETSALLESVLGAANAVEDAKIVPVPDSGIPAPAAAAAELAEAPRGISENVDVKAPEIGAASESNAHGTNGTANGGKAPEPETKAAPVVRQTMPSYYTYPNTGYTGERSSDDRKSYQARALGRRTLSYQSRSVVPDSIAVDCSKTANHSFHF